MSPIPDSGDLPLRDRSFVVALVVLAHALLLLSYTSSSGLSRPAHRELSISVALASPPQAAPVKPAVNPKPSSLGLCNKSRHQTCLWKRRLRRRRWKARLPGRKILRPDCRIVSRITRRLT